MIGRIKSQFWRRVALVAFAPVLILLYAVLNVCLALFGAAWLALQDIAESW